MLGLVKFLFCFVIYSVSLELLIVLSFTVHPLISMYIINTKIIYIV